MKYRACRRSSVGDPSARLAALTARAPLGLVLVRRAKRPPSGARAGEPRWEAPWQDARPRSEVVKTVTPVFENVGNAFAVHNVRAQQTWWAFEEKMRAGLKRNTSRAP